MHRLFNRRLSALALSALAFAILVGTTPAQTGTNASRGDLHGLFIGIGQYIEPGQDLDWAAESAVDCEQFWRSQEGGLYDRYQGDKPLLDREATRDAILRRMNAIKQRAKAGDTVVATFCGHGYIDAKTGEWVFCAADCVIDRQGVVQSGCLTASEFRAWVTELSRKGARVVLILDSCHSGAIDINVDGVVVLSACQAHQVTLAGAPLAVKSQFLFTQVLLEALNGKADANGDGIVTLEEVQDYLAKHVPALREKLRAPDAKHGPQRPVIFRTSNTPGSLPLAGRGHTDTGHSR